MISAQEYLERREQRRPGDARIPLKEVDIPIISEDSSREELLTYIRILEDRLEIGDVLEVSDGTDVQPSTRIFDRLVRKELEQSARVELLQSENDGIGIRDLSLKFVGVSATPVSKARH